MKLITALKNLGYALTLEGDNIRLRFLGIGEHPAEAQPIIEELKARKAEAMQYLREETRPLPYLDLDGGLVIPFAADPCYHYWNGGQSVVKTEEEVRQWKH